METKFSYLIIGFFVLVFSVATVIIGVWLVSFGTKKYNVYIVYMHESVAGLNLNSPVKYNGVDVGYIQDITLRRNDPQTVRIVAKIQEGTPITTTTTATMITQGLTGIAYLGLKTQNDQGVPLKPLPGHRYPVIRAEPSLYSRLEDTLQALSQSLKSVSDGVNQLLSPENQKAFSGILVNVDQISAQTAHQFPAFMNKLNQTTEAVKGLTLKLENNPGVIIRGEEPPPPGPGE